MSLLSKTFAHSSKTLAVSEHLAALALELGPEAKLPTVQELRRELNVSIATLDNALTHLETQKVIYRKHGVGIFVSPHVGRKAIALVCDPGFFRGGMSPFWQELIEGARAYGVAHGETCRFYLALPSSSGGSPVPDDFLEDLRARRIDGVLFVGDNPGAVKWILNQGIPAVSFAGWSHWMVAIDYLVLTRMGLGMLQRQSCQKVGYLVPFLPSREGGFVVPHSGAEVFCQIGSQLGMETRPEWIWDLHRYPQHAQATTPQEQGYNAILTMYQDARPGQGAPSALLSMDDMMTRGALVAMQKLGLRPGEDITLATHCNRGSAVLQGYEADLTFLEIDPGQIVTAMFSQLKAVLENPETPPCTVAITPQEI